MPDKSNCPWSYIRTPYNLGIQGNISKVLFKDNFSVIYFCQLLVKVLRSCYPCILEFQSNTKTLEIQYYFQDLLLELSAYHVYILILYVLSVKDLSESIICSPKYYVQVFRVLLHVTVL